MANNVKFECYDSTYPGCNETEDTRFCFSFVIFCSVPALDFLRNHPGVKKILDTVVERVKENIDKWPLDTKLNVMFYLFKRSQRKAHFCYFRRHTPWNS